MVRQTLDLPSLEQIAECHTLSLSALALGLEKTQEDKSRLNDTNFNR